MADREPGISKDTLARLTEIVGPENALIDRDGMAPLLKSWRDNWQGSVPMVVFPSTTEQVAEIVRLCAETGTPIVPQGGNTGLTGASQPHNDDSEIILSTRRMNRILATDLENDTITVEAGCILQTIQQAAETADRLFPLSLAAEGSCQIGGNLSTNAGGTQVLRYGNARNLVLGLEAVLPDGEIWNGLKGLRKDNTGYDLKQLFIGAEGTLGIITKAVLRLFPRPSAIETALVAVPDPAAAVTLLGRLRQTVGEAVSGFEIIQRIAIDMALRHVPGVQDPLSKSWPWYVLLEVSGQGPADSLTAQTEAALAAAMEDGIVEDAVLAQSATQRQQLWHIREAIPEAQNHEGASIKHDVSVPVSRIASFLDRASAELTARYPGVRIVAFGHIGDGNIHFNPAEPPGFGRDAFYAEQAAVNRIVHDIIADLDGSISAEHGLGRLRMDEAAHYKSPVEIALMRKLKSALDPKNIMNPGKVVRL